MVGSCQYRKAMATSAIRVIRPNLFICAGSFADDLIILLSESAIIIAETFSGPNAAAADEANLLMKLLSAAVKSRVRNWRWF